MSKLFLSNRIPAEYNRQTWGDLLRNIESTVNKDVIDKLDNYIDVKNDYGAIGDGVADDSSAIQAAITAATSGQAIYFPAGKYSCSSGFTITSAITFIGDGLPGVAGTNGGSSLYHNFDGDWFTFTGADGTGFGGGFKDIALLQNFGTTGNAYGTAIKITGSTTSNRAGWMRLQNLQIEERTSAQGRFTWCINIDGSPVGGTDGIRDFWIKDSRFVGATTGGAVNIKNAFNVFVVNCLGNAAGSDLVVGGTSGNVSSSVYVTNSSFPNLEIDYASNVFVNGGAYTTFSTTANSTNVSAPLDYLTTAPTSVLGTSVNISWLDDTTGSRIHLGTQDVPFVFGRDSDAGDSTNFVDVAVGNYGASQGHGSIRYTNAAAIGAPSFSVRAFPRNNADSSNFFGGGVTWTKTAAADTTGVTLEDSSNDYLLLDAANNKADLAVSNTVVLRADANTTAAETRLYIYDVDNGQLERVSVGAADSGGTNYKLLRIPN